MPESIPVIINIAEQATKTAIQSAEYAEKNGADGLMLLPPMRYKADDRETNEYFKTVAANTSLPIMIYNNPYDYKIEVTDIFIEGDTVAAFGFAEGTFKGIKTEQNKNYWKLPAAWKAVIENGKVKLWQVYADTKITCDIISRNK